MHIKLIIRTSNRQNQELKMTYENNVFQNDFMARRMSKQSERHLDIHDDGYLSEFERSVDSNELFIELDTLHMNYRTNTYCWAEKSRWIVYQEDYDMKLNILSCPHLSAVSTKGLQSFRTLFKKGHTSLNYNAMNYLTILNVFSESAANSGKYSDKEMAEIRNALSLNHHRDGMSQQSLKNEARKVLYNKNNQCFQRNENCNILTNQRRRFSSLTIGEMFRRQSYKKLTDGLIGGTEGMLVQIGVLETIHDTHSVFIRLDQPILEDGLMDIRCPLRFIFIIFGPKNREEELIEIGQSFSVMMSNLQYRDKVYRAKSKNDVLAAAKAFVESSVLLNVDTRITNEAYINCLPTIKQYAYRIITARNKPVTDLLFKNKADEIDPAKLARDQIVSILNSKVDANYSQFGPNRKTSKRMKDFKISMVPFRQVYLDLKGMKRRYLSDFSDAFTKENYPTVFIGIIFTYFVLLSPSVTFGALFSTFSPKITVTMCLIASGVFQLLYVLLSGQPLEIVGITPTVLVIEQVVASLSSTLQVKIEIMRFWIGFYLACMGFMFTMFNGSVIIQNLRRSVEEVYNSYFSILFILAPLFAMFKALPYSATSITDPHANATAFYNERVKFGVGGVTLFLALVMFNFCLYVVKINRGIYLRRSIRKALGSFNVPLGIIFISSLNTIFFSAYQMPTLNIPPSNFMNTSLWINVPPFDLVFLAPPSVHGYGFCIAVTISFMLSIEISMNSICTSKIERKLKKKSLYSMNYICIMCLFPLMSIFLGWPFFSGAMVRSNAYCILMAKYTYNKLPGVPKRVVGECEQRVSGIIVSLLVIVSVFLGSALQYIPMATMYGMSLFMGIVGVRDMVLWKRFVNLLQRRKYWKDHDYLKGYPTWNLLTLAFIQIFFVLLLCVLYVLSQFTVNVWTLFLFPPIVGLYALIRGYALPYWPRFNAYLSEMDKKHIVRLYDGKSEVILQCEKEDDMAMTKVNDPEEDLSHNRDHEADMY